MVKYSALLDTTFSALADPTRRAILARLALSETSVKELSEPFSISPPAISKHLRVLERAGLLTRRKDGRMHRCHLEARTLKPAAEWIARYRRFWEERFQALEEYLKESHAQEEKVWRPRKRRPRSHSGSRRFSGPRERRSSAPGRTRKP